MSDRVEVYSAEDDRLYPAKLREYRGKTVLVEVHNMLVECRSENVYIGQREGEG